MRFYKFLNDKPLLIVNIKINGQLLYTTNCKNDLTLNKQGNTLAKFTVRQAVEFSRSCNSKHGYLVRSHANESTYKKIAALKKENKLKIEFIKYTEKKSVSTYQKKQDWKSEREKLKVDMWQKEINELTSKIIRAKRVSKRNVSL